MNEEKSMLEKGVDLVNQASQQSDRWLFIASLVLLVAGGAMAIRWLVNKNEKMLDTHHSTLQKIAGDQNETHLKLAVVLDRNTNALNECATEIRYSRESRK